MAGYIYNIGYDELASGGGTDWLVDDIVVILVTSSYNIDLVNHQYISDLTDELSGGNYNRVSLSSKTRTFVTNAEILSSGSITFALLGAAAGTPGYFVLARNTGLDSSSPLLGVFELAPLAPDGNNYVITVPSEGFFVFGPFVNYTLSQMLHFRGQ